MNDYPYHFDAKIVKHGMGKMNFCVVYLPKDLAAKLPFGTSKRLRIDGEVNGIRFDGALMPAKGKWYLMVSKKLQQLCGLSLGQVASVSFEIANPDRVSLPDELHFALDANEQAAQAWERWTAGKRRGWAYRISQAKLAETRQKRIEELLEILCASSAQ